MSQDREQLTADLIHAVRAQGLTPATMGSTFQWRTVVNALLATGWAPPSTEADDDDVFDELAEWEHLHR